MATHQKASIEIVNHTGRTLVSVTVAHKYSDIEDYNKKHTWELIENGKTTPTALVDFNTGWLTTGRDWWSVTWVDDKGHTYIADPKNFRDIMDFLEKIGDKISEPLATLAAYTAAGDVEPTTKVVAAAVAVTSAVAAALLNCGSTDGFKQHILREEDRDRPTRIIIKPNEIEFNSKSGKSTTGFRKW